MVGRSPTQLFMWVKNTKTTYPKDKNPYVRGPNHQLAHISFHQNCSFDTSWRKETQLPHMPHVWFSLTAENPNSVLLLSPWMDAVKIRCPGSRSFLGLFVLREKQTLLSVFSNTNTFKLVWKGKKEKISTLERMMRKTSYRFP